MITGSCLCGTVRYRVDGPLTGMSHCHCTMCRKAHGAAFATYVSCAPEHFEWLAGEDAVVGYASSPGVERRFCRRCGSVVPSPFGDKLDLPAGNLLGDPGIRAECHIFTADAAPWHVITDDLPRHERWSGAPPRKAIEREPPGGGAPAGVLRGSCLCGAVAFEVGTPFTRTHNCYCSRCRKARSAAHASNGFTAIEGVRFTRGADHVTSYKLPEAKFFTIAFCDTCGSGVARLDPGRGIAIIPLGALDDDPGRGIDSDIYAADAAPWYPVTGTRPRFDGPPT